MPPTLGRRPFRRSDGRDGPAPSARMGVMSLGFESTQSVAILGGGPGGYEAALAAAQLGAEVTLVERAGVGGSAVITDVVPSKSLIATADAAVAIAGAASDLGVQLFARDGAGKPLAPEVAINLAAVNKRLLSLARQQSDDLRATLLDAGVRIVSGQGRLDGNRAVVVSTDVDGTDFDRIEADTLVVSVGGPARASQARPDGERILTWTQLYDMKAVPEHLIVVGSGVTGAEFASAYMNLGARVTLVSSRDQVLPGEDADAAAVLERVFARGGMTLLSKSRADTVQRTASGVIVTLGDGRTVEGSHCLMAVGSIPNTRGIGLEEAGVQLTESGHIRVNRVARTSVPNIYAAGDCTNFVPLASVASMQGRTAVFHALGDVAIPIERRRIAANIFTAPEIATVGWQERDVEHGLIDGIVHKLPLAANARAKMMGIKDGFVKIIAREGSGTVIGGVIVGPRASELIYPIAIAVERRLTVDQVSRVFTVFPSLTGSIQDAFRAMHQVDALPTLADPARGAAQTIARSGWPAATVCPGSASIALIVPSLCAWMGCSIFIASRTTTRSPLTTCCPSSTAIFTTVACMGAFTASPVAPAFAVAVCERRDGGTTAGRPARTPGVAMRSGRLTSRRFPATSTTTVCRGSGWGSSAISPSQGGMSPANSVSIQRV